LGTVQPPSGLASAPARRGQIKRNAMPKLELGQGRAASQSKVGPVGQCSERRQKGALNGREQATSGQCNVAMHGYVSLEKMAIGGRDVAASANRPASQPLRPGRKHGYLPPFRATAPGEYTSDAGMNRQVYGIGTPHQVTGHTDFYGQFLLTNDHTRKEPCLASRAGRCDRP